MTYGKEFVPPLSHAQREGAPAPRAPLLTRILRSSQQKEIYQRTAAPIVGTSRSHSRASAHARTAASSAAHRLIPRAESVIEGFNGTIFAYGQTGAGKSFTMEGKSDPPELRGIIPNSFKHIFDTINSADASADTQYLVRASYLEIYNEEIRDLLGRDPRQRLELKESVDSGVYVKVRAFPLRACPASPLRGLLTLAPSHPCRT